MTLFKRGDVLLVPFPFSDQSTFKKRPAIIVSSDPFNRYSDDIFVIAVTSNITRGKLGDISIENWQEAGLLKPSLIKPAISTIEKKLVIKTLGSLSHDDTISLDKTLAEILALY